MPGRYLSDIGLASKPFGMSSMIERRPFDRLESAEHVLVDGRLACLVPAKARAEVNGVAFDARDGAAIDAEPSIKVVALEEAELVLVDVTR